MSAHIDESGDNAFTFNEGELNSATHFSGIFEFLIRKWWLFFGVAIISGISGIFFVILQKPNYESKLTFALDEGGGSGGGVGNFLSFASQLGINFGGSSDIFSGDNIIEIMKSRRMIENVLLSTDTFHGKPYTLIEYYLEMEGQRKPGNKISDIHFPTNQLKSKFSYRQDSLLYVVYVKFISGSIRAGRPDKKLSIFEVNVTTQDERFTKIFTDRVVSYTNDYYTEIRTKKAKETLDVLENRVASMRGNLNSSISDKAVSQDKNLNPAFAAAQVPILKQQTNIQVYGGAYAEMFKNLEIARFQYLKEIPLMQIIDKADYPMKRIKKSKLTTGLIFSCLAVFILFFILIFQRIFFPYLKYALKRKT